ncbi:MAG TPA: carbohydrate ABC transporter permease [Streptosporangiaceae bacterium]|nr:carbohydrate ABC transporter permease [Streptosporangiaceae bacterium]
MSATSLTSHAAGQGRGPGFRPRRTWLTLPATWVVILVVLGLTLVPMLYVIIGGFRTTAQLNTSPAGLPSPWVWSNYRSVLTSATFWHALGNSAVISAVATVLAVGLGAMAALALSRYSFRGREGFYLTFVAGLLFPLNTAVLPLYLLLQKIGLLDNVFGVALPLAAFQLPVTILILRPFMRAIPGELEDAAVVDGATRFRFFLRILLPLSRPALITVAILAFVVSWNSYFLPLAVLNTQSKFPLPLAVANFQSQFTQDTAGVFAFTALSMIPALAVFVFAQRRLVGALAGALKA